MVERTAPRKTHILIPAWESLARDQAMLAIAHLQMIAIQWQSVALYETGSLNEFCIVVEQFVEITTDVQDDLQVGAQKTLSDARAVDRHDGDAVRAALHRLDKAADLSINRHHADKSLSASIQDAVPNSWRTPVTT